MVTIPFPDIPVEVILFSGILEMALIAAVVFFGGYWMDMRSKNPELHVFNRARSKPFPPIVRMTDLSGRELYFNADKEKPEDIKLQKDDYGLLIDPRYASKMPKSHLEDGVPVFDYGAGFHFPVDKNGARGIIQLIRKVRKEYPQLNFIRDDLVIMDLLMKSSGDDLFKDIQLVIEMFPIENIEIDMQTNGGEQNNLINPNSIKSIVEEIKTKLKSWKVEPGYFSMKDALGLLPIGTTSRDMKELESITKTNLRNELGQKLEWWKEMMPVFFYAMAAIVISYLVITAMKPN